MNIEDDMLEYGFNNEQDYLEYLHNKAENIWDKQLEKDKKADEWERYLESLTTDDIEEIQREEQEKRKRLIRKRLIKEDQEHQLKTWKENNFEERILWDSKWANICIISSYLIDNEYKDEYDEWKKWLATRNTFRKWKSENLEKMKNWWDLREKEAIINWVDLDMIFPERVDEFWTDFSLWKEDHINEWYSYKENCNTIQKNNYLHDICAWCKIETTYWDNKSDVTLEIWISDNEKDWKKWKSEKEMRFLNNSIRYNNKYVNITDYHYNYFKTWRDNHLEIWHKWKNKKSYLLQIWEKEFLDFWIKVTEFEPKELYKKGIKDINHLNDNCTEGGLEWEVSTDELWRIFLYENKNLVPTREERHEDYRRLRHEKSKMRSIYEEVYQIEPESIIISFNKIREKKANQLSKNTKIESKYLKWISDLCEKKLGMLWIKENKLVYEKWMDYYLWEEENLFCLRNGKKKSINGYEEWLDNLKNKGDIKIVLFELWKEKNKERWLLWKSEYYDVLRSKINDLLLWETWTKKHPYRWKEWADERLDSWKSWKDNWWNDELYFSWTEDHFGEREDYNKWLLEEKDNWNIWENELRDRFFKRNRKSYT